MPGHDEIARRATQLQKIDPGEFFAAVIASGTGQKSLPKVIMGLSYAGSREELESLIGELRQGVQKAWPAGKSDILPYGSGEIETFTAGGSAEALAYRGHWLFLASDVDLLKAVLDGCDGKGAGPTLREADDFKKCLGQLPADPDNLVFVQPRVMAESFSSMMLMIQPEADTRQMDYMRKTPAYAMATKLDGPLVRESIFLLRPPVSGPFSGDGLKLATADTVVLTEGNIGNSSLGMSQLQSQMAPAMAILQRYLKPFQDQGLTLEDLAQAFGPETAFLLDWPTATPIPTPLAALGVADSAKARKFLDALTAPPLSDLGVHFTKHETEGVSYYTMASTSLGFFPLQFTLCLTDKSLLGGLSIPVVQDAVKRLPGPGGLAGTDAYRQAMALVPPPTLGEAYVNTRTIFERIYNLVRGVASMGMIPHSGDYLDLGKLPETETISRHLTPLVLSQSGKEGGILSESAGPVSFTQAGAVVGAGALAALVPYMRSLGHAGLPSPAHSPAPLPVPAPPAPAPIPGSAHPQVPPGQACRGVSRKIFV